MRHALGAWMVTCALCLGACEGGAVPSGDAGLEPPVDAGWALAMDTACVAVCGEAECGQPDGCGGVCPPCELAACDCDARVCGDDGCGGSCGACAAGESCSADGNRCDCGDATVTYRFSAPEIDWRTTARVVVTARQRFASESEPSAQTIVLDRYYPERELSFVGACEPDLEVRWEYVAVGRDALGRALHCDGSVWDLKGATDIALPAGTGGACRPR